MTHAFRLSAALALTIPIALDDEQSRPARHAPSQNAGRTPALTWTPSPWVPPGFERLNRLLATGHLYRSMAWP